MRHNWWTKPRFKSVDEWTGEYQLLSFKDVAILLGALFAAVGPILIFLAIINEQCKVIHNDEVTTAISGEEQA